ncbi:unnamed protein product [Ectocarpus sp. CCAP 1310/34]|nr:unnamed protein product [Ectocarpus sp. CCAP 1310/34]
MSSGNVELLGDNVEILDYEPEGEAPTAEQFPAASAEDESPPMSMVFTVDDLLSNIATADPAELERAYNTGRVSLEDIVEAARLSSDSPLFVPPFSLPPEDRLILLPHDELMAYQRLNEVWCDGLAGKIAEAEAREQAKREDAERLAEREAALAAAARKQEEERAAVLAEREAYLQAARAKQGALRSRLKELEPRHQDPRAAPHPRRRVIAPPPTQSQVHLGPHRTASPHDKEREVAASPTNEQEQTRTATPDFSVAWVFRLVLKTGHRLRRQPRCTSSTWEIQRSCPARWRCLQQVSPSTTKINWQLFLHGLASNNLSVHNSPHRTPLLSGTSTTHRTSRNFRLLRGSPCSSCCSLSVVPPFLKVLKERRW